MKLIVGLGNPGEKYERNRHNVGFMFCDYIAEQYQKSNSKDQKYISKFKNDKYNNVAMLQFDNLILAKPQAFMNRSGETVKKLIGNWKLEIGNLIVAHDDLDIALGDFKIQKGTGPKLHNGITSIETHLNTKDFLRVRIGVEARGEHRIDGETYVLSDFFDEEKKTLEGVFEKIWLRLKDH